MKELTIEEKIAEIKNTSNYQDVKNAWFPPYYEKEYYFVSYSHKDYKLVYESLHRLQSGEKRLNLWYDHNLTPGRDWEIEARRYIYDFNCKGVIFFLSENAVLSQSIHKEIEFVKNSGKSYLSINLPCEKIKGHIGEYLAAAQMLELLKQQGCKIENYDEKSVVLNETFNDKITFLPFNEDMDSQITKILSLKRQPLLNIDTFGRVTSINDINVLEIKREDFIYYDEIEGKRKYASTIDDCAFANCQYLENVVLPNEIHNIGKFAFLNCKSLIQIELPEKVHAIFENTFDNCHKLTRINLASITDIGDSAFAGCYSLTSVILQHEIKSIGNNAFMLCCSLKHIDISDGRILIGQGAFEGTEYYSNKENWIDNVLYINKNLITVKEGISNSYIIKDGTKTIAGRAFEFCESITNITIPSSIIIIGNSSFARCKNLKDIFYNGRQRWWKRIKKGKFWDSGTPDYTVHCADGDLKKGEF